MDSIGWWDGSLLKPLEESPGSKKGRHTERGADDRMLSSQLQPNSRPEKCHLSYVRGL